MNNHTRKSMRFVTGLRFTGWMWLALAAIVGLSVHFTLLLEDGRTLPGDYQQLDSLIADLEYDIGSLSELSPLPPLESQWRLLAAKAEMNQVKMETVADPVGLGFENYYRGPLKSWAAILTGNPTDVLALAQALQEEMPIYLYDYSVDSEVMKLNVVVVGI
jgi:hypothetical protein